VIRFLTIVSLTVFIGCADRSKGVALNECRQQYYLRDAATQGKLMSDCMAAKSYQTIAACSPVPDEREWDTLVRMLAYNNPQCYRPLGSIAWIATAFSPM
jgi:hypothetical protein